MFPELPALDEQFRQFSTSMHPSPKLSVDAYLAA